LTPLIYELPSNRIAQRPIGFIDRRSNAKLLVARNIDNKLSITDSRFTNLLHFLSPGDLLVMNNTAVIPCRFFVKLDPNSSSYLEIFILEKHKCEDFIKAKIIGKPMKKLTPGLVFPLSQRLLAEVIAQDDNLTENNQREIKIRSLEENVSLDRLLEFLDEDGTMPIPPYIRGGHGDESDRELYQTVYSALPGSVAAPTAGLHFTAELLNTLKEHQIKISYLTLHVGLASIVSADRQTSTENKNTSAGFPERFAISEATQDSITEAKSKDKRVIAVGTTTTRALESFYGPLKGTVPDQEGFYTTDLMIKPGFRFNVCDAMITNFHQSGSTHLLLVAAFMGEENISAIYQHGLNTDYRFLSYGDSMLLMPKS
jgi:S-adenosylmethionine:tRNA ribosyltransferase-isomerase